MTIKDLEKDKEFKLVTDSQDVKETLKYFGKLKLYDKYQGLFVKTSNGDYEQVYGFEGIVPKLDKEVYQIYPAKNEESPYNTFMERNEKYIRNLIKKVIREQEEEESDEYQNIIKLLPTVGALEKNLKGYIIYDRSKKETPTQTQIKFGWKSKEEKYLNNAKHWAEEVIKGCNAELKRIKEKK